MSRLRGQLIPAAAAVLLLVILAVVEMQGGGTKSAEPQKQTKSRDGSSGGAWLMELAHHMKQLPTEVGVDFVLFDGEEFVFDGPHGQDRYFFGSDHFADEYRRTPPKHRYVGAVLLDLIAGKNAKYPI